MSFEKDISAILPAVARAVELARRAQKSGLAEKTTKSDGTAVTAADYAAQFILTKAIEEHFPGDAVVAEETAENTGAADAALKLLGNTGRDDFVETLGRGGGGGGGRFWTVDPIDGTAGFVDGAHFCVAVALIVEGEAAAGALGCPGLGFIMSAARGGGVRKKPVAGEKTDLLIKQGGSGRGPVLCESARAREQAYADTGEIMRRAGGRGRSVRMDGQGKYALIAEGRADVYIRVPNRRRRESVWDHAAGTAIAEAAGARVADFDGDALDFGAGRTLPKNRGIVAARGGVFEKVLRAIKDAGL
ncbi:MAG: hypothetical protein OXF42_03315 [Candidatus Dadabacteria bacterium]|nr:hypothetical protein [Candidatus Dadabacteria bacterium]